jgi:hypothetical protein
MPFLLMILKKEAKASMAARRTYHHGALSQQSIPTKIPLATYLNCVVLETLLESRQDGLFVLLFDNAWSRREYTEGVLALLRLGSLAQLEQRTKKLRPVLICVGGRQVSQSRNVQLVEENQLFSVYWRASSATASLILLRTARSVSVPRVSRSFCLMTAAWSLERLIIMSTVSPLSIFLVLELMRRKMTAAKERICRRAQD